MSGIRDLLGLLGVLSVCLPALASAQTAPAERAVEFTQDQAAAGRGSYRRSCAPCHKANLEGEGLAPSLTGERFARQWAGRPSGVLLSHMRRMPIAPIGEPGSLSDEDYANVMAFMLERGGLEAGETALPSNPEALARLQIPASDVSLARSSGSRADTPAPWRSSQRLSQLPAVTAEMLENPGAEDWMIWRRTQDSQGFSPLQQIHRGNVAGLKLAWRTPLEDGENMPSPLVHRGVMFLHTYPDTTLALDAATGALLWSHTYEPQGQSSKKMGLALHGGKVFVPTSDLHLLALDVRTGKPIWDFDIETESPKSESYQLRSAPLVAGNLVIQGVMSFRVPRGSFVVAVDIETGKEAWRFNTVARPGEPGGNTWNDLPLEKRNGGSVWVAGTYDPELGLVYFGPAPTYDTGPLLEAVEKEGVNNDALYTNATVAVDAKTGKLVWYFQHLANDQWDLDWAFERQIVELPVDGVSRKVVLTVGKAAIVEALDAATGEYLFSIDLGLQNVIQSIDPTTGDKTVWPDSVPSLTQPRLICPTAVGARSWPPTSFNPETRMLYIPLTEGCMTGGPQGFKGLLTSGVGLTMQPHPASSDGNMGRLQAVNLSTRQMAWSHRQPTPLVSSTLATAGGLVFVGDLEPSLKAFDQTSGDLLWTTALADSPGSSLVTYGVDNRQYVALVVGQENNVTRDWTRIYRGIAKDRGLDLPEPPRGGAAILVFALNPTSESE